MEINYHENLGNVIFWVDQAVKEVKAMGDIPTARERIEATRTILIADQMLDEALEEYESFQF